MAKQRNYTPPRLVFRQHFLDDSIQQSVPAYVHISGPHANFVSSKDASAESGFLGAYGTTGLHVELPRILAGNTLDRDSVSVSMKNVWLQYFKPTTETFSIPAGARNVVTASDALQTAGFSFRTNGPVSRAGVFFDRDVSIGDGIKLTANIGGEAKDLVTTVAAIRPRYTSGIVDPDVVLGDANIATQTAALTITGTSEAAATVAVAVTPDADWYDPMLAKGIANDTYKVEVVIGGSIGACRFRVTSAKGDNVASVAAVDEEDEESDSWSVAVGSLAAKLMFTADAADIFTTDMSWTVTAAAKTTAVTASAGGEYLGPAEEMQPRETIYMLTVTKGGTIPVTAPATEAEKLAAPTISVNTTDGSDKLPVVRVLEQGAGTAIGRFKTTVTFSGSQLYEGDKFFVTVKSAYSDIYPTIVLNKNIPDEWIDDTDPIDVSLSLYIVSPEADIPEFAMTGSGRVENWTLETDGIRLRSDLSLYTPTWTVGGMLSELPVADMESPMSNKVYMSMRYFVPDLANQILAVRSLEDLDDLVSGPVTPDNPLKYAAYYALIGGGNLEGSEVFLTGVLDPNDLTEWENVLDIISERSDIFHLLPLTGGNRDVEKLFYEHTKEMNRDEVARERVLYLIASDQQTVPILTDSLGQAVTGKLEVEVSVGSSTYAAYTVATPNIDFTALGVKAGDTIRTRYDFDASGREAWEEYKITEVINSETLRLDMDPANVVPDQVAMAFELWRTQNNLDYAHSISETGGFDDMLVKYLYADNLDPNFHPLTVCAKLVGLIGAVVPHQGVSWFPLDGEGVDAENWVNRFSTAQMNLMGGNGVLLITKHADGYVCARHAVTTNKSPESPDPRTNLDMKKTEEMFVRNALLLKKEYRNALKGFVGISNNVEGTRLAIATNITMISDLLKNDADYPRLGGRILEGPLELSVRPHPLFADRTTVSFRVTGPVPLNTLECDMYI